MRLSRGLEGLPRDRVGWADGWEEDVDGGSGIVMAGLGRKAVSSRGEVVDDGSGIVIARLGRKAMVWNRYLYLDVSAFRAAERISGDSQVNPFGKNWGVEGKQRAGSWSLRTVTTSTEGIRTLQLKFVLLGEKRDR